MWAEFTTRFKSSQEEFSTLEDRIQESHHRCEMMNVCPNEDRIQDILEAQELKQVVQTHAGLIIYSKLAFSKAFQSLDDKRAMFILTDARARIIALYSYSVILNAAAQKGVCLGASLGETSLGTNAVSMALHDFESAIVRGPQHYCRLFHGWYCVAAPILGANGRPIGCLDISTSDTGPMGEKLALVNFLANDFGNYCKQNVVSDIEFSTVGDKSAEAEIRLTERQHQVLLLFSRGLSYKQIAKNLELRSVKTVQEHLDAVRVKLGTTNRRDCIRKAIELGLLNG